jgi:hypothetical protein
MGMFSMCSICGSDWCNRGECVTDKLKHVREYAVGLRNGYKASPPEIADDLLEILDDE